jgi:PhnB protein
MATSVKRVPEGFHTITAGLTIKGAAEAIEFYKQALGAQEIMRMTGPNGLIGHAELRIGDSVLFITDEMPNMGMCKSPQTLGGTTGSLYLYVDDVDSAFDRAVKAGGKATMPVADMFWGDRFGSFEDPFGYIWGVSTHVRDLSPEQIEEAAKEFYAEMAQQAQKKTA